MGSAMDPGHGTMRLVRGGVLATCSVLLGLSGHLLGGGSGQVVAPTVLAGAVIGVASVAWAHRRRGFGQLMGAAVLAQVAFYGTLALASSHGSVHHHDGMTAAWSGQRMMLAHAVAAVLMAAVLAHGDAVLWSLGRMLPAVVRPGRWPVPVVRGTLPPPDGGERAPRRALVVAATQPHRGPPGPVLI